MVIDLVRPVEEAFRIEARPLNLEASNIVWVSASEIDGSASIDLPTAADGTEIAFLWGELQDREPSGILVKLRAGSAGVLGSRGSTLRAVVIQGSCAYDAAGGPDSMIMGPGSYIGATEATTRISCESGEDCILYVRTED